MRNLIVGEGIAMLALLLPLGVLASDEEHGKGHGSEEHGGGHGHAIPHHHLALFAGAGSEREKGHEKEIGFAIGLEYEYRFHSKWGIGGVIEGLGGDTLREIVVVAPISFHPNGNWRLFAGPGYEFSETKDHAMLRTGVGYSIPINDTWVVAPELIADFIDGGKEVYLFGLAFGRAF